VAGREPVYSVLWPAIVGLCAEAVLCFFLVDRPPELCRFLAKECTIDTSLHERHAVAAAGRGGEQVVLLEIEG
jgi:hypothetical protein